MLNKSILFSCLSPESLRVRSTLYGTHLKSTRTSLSQERHETSREDLGINQCIAIYDCESTDHPGLSSPR